jgi:hypothetical protein
MWVGLPTFWALFGGHWEIFSQKRLAALGMITVEKR